jgi:hypothetical protein
MRPLTSQHPKIEQFLRLWHENGRARFQRSASSHNYDTQQRKIAKDRRQYILLNSGDDRVFLVQRSTHYVYQVDDYGRRGKFLNTLDALIEQYTMANERQEEAEATIRMAGLDREKNKQELLRAPFTSSFDRLQWRSMADEYEVWLSSVRDALRSINMQMEDWQGMWPFDFSAEYRAGTNPDAAAMKANRFWWHRQNKSIGRVCEKIPGCWLPQGHQGECQPNYEPGDHIKVEFEGENGMPGEWMWVIVLSRDDKKRIVYGTLDNEPVNEYSGNVKLGSELAISYDKVREHSKPGELTKK